MSWSEHHSESERLAAEAELALRRRETPLSLELYVKAAESETSALMDLDKAKVRTLGISVVSAVSLWFKGRENERAEQAACQWLATKLLPPFAVEQLKGLLQAIWNEQIREKADVQFTHGQVLVSIKGGEVVTGGAPLDLVVEKVQTIQALYYRTTEFVNNLPHRKHGPPIRAIQDACRPWLFQSGPGSYQFEVAVQEKPQQELFDDGKPKAREIAAQFLEILRASSEDPETALPEIVSDKEYRTTFLKLTRNLAPSGKSFKEMEVRSAVEASPITLVPGVRDAIRQVLKKDAPPKDESGESHEETLQGVLRAVHLEKDWLEVTVDDQLIHVQKVGESMDDVIGPMVNRPVTVKAIKDKKGRFFFRDIEPQD